MEKEFGPWAKDQYHAAATWLLEHGPKLPEQPRLEARFSRKLSVIIGLSLAAMVSEPLLNQPTGAEMSLPNPCPVANCYSALSRIALSTEAGFQTLSLKAGVKSKQTSSTTSPAATRPTAPHTPLSANKPHQVTAAASQPLQLLILAPGTSSSQIGYDVSHPNCQQGIPQDAPFGVVGVNGGLSTTYNSCLKQEAGDFKNLQLYFNVNITDHVDQAQIRQLNVSCPPRDWDCEEYKAGYLQGKNTAEHASKQGVHARLWWGDVETCNGCWSDDVIKNRSVIEGEIDAIKKFGHAEVGIYSNSFQWEEITGNVGNDHGWKNGLPNWVPTGGGSLAQAQSYCSGQSFNGGPTIMTQFGEIQADKQYDRDWLCPPAKN